MCLYMLGLSPGGAEQEENETKSLAPAVFAMDVTTDGIYGVFILVYLLAIYISSLQAFIAYRCCIYFFARNTSTTDRQTCGGIVGAAFRRGASAHRVVMVF